MCRCPARWIENGIYGCAVAVLHFIFRVMYSECNVWLDVVYRFLPGMVWYGGMFNLQPWTSNPYLEPIPSPTFNLELSIFNFELSILTPYLDAHHTSHIALDTLYIALNAKHITLNAKHTTHDIILSFQFLMIIIILALAEKKFFDYKFDESKV